MTNQSKLIIYLYLLVSFLASPNIAFALDESGPELIWKIGADEAPPDYTEKAFDEFDCDKPFNPHYYVHTDPYSKFPQGINDGEFTQIYIHYNLTYEQANKTLGLLIDTLYATHDSGVDRISDYNMRISVKPPDRNWTEIGEFNFASSPPYGDGPEEQFIVIDNSYLGVGENIILLEDANPKLSWHWLNWDSLKLVASRTIIITTSNVVGDIYVDGIFQGHGEVELLEYRSDGLHEIFYGDCEGYYKCTNHTVSFGEVGDCFVGYMTPEPLHITVDSNKSEVVYYIVYYTKIPSRTISITTVTEDGSNFNGPIYIDGIFQGRGGAELECRSDILHEISYGDCEEYHDNERKKPKYITPSSTTVNITKGNCFAVGVYGIIKYPPIANIIPVKPEAALYEDVAFNAGASYDLDGRIVRYIWDFSDGVAEGEVTSHRFATTGNKIVKLTVIDNEGDQSTDMVNVVVKRKPIVKLTKINDTRISIAIFNPMVRPADPHKTPAAVSVDAMVEVSSRIGVTMSTDGLFHCNLDQGEKFEEEISVECEEPYDVWLEYTYKFQDEDELRSSHTNCISMPAKPSGKKPKSIPNLPSWIGVFIILMVFTIKKRGH
jgi:PKD repeat protein